MAARTHRPGPGNDVTDGRVQRSLRSRQRILDAMIELIQDGELQPTGQQVADRAGVGLRTVFRHFEDMETLFSELRERVEKELRPQVTPRPIAGSLDERLAAFARGRARAFERLAPYQRSERIHRWHSAVLQDAHATMLREQREHLLEALPEVEGVPPEIRQAIEVVTGFEFWDLLRSDQGLGVARAEETLRETTRALLAMVRR
ncbi:MAG: TetR/AcrR family transcriptional regulator [Myxococcota bacterium]